MSIVDAVRAFVTPGAVLGMGGQNINRCPMALTHEIIRQRIGELTVVGCNLSLPMDLLVAAGLVARTEQGSGNLERYGVLFSWRKAVEAGTVTVLDYSHLSGASRFLAGAMGLPFLPIRSLLGSSVLDDLVEAGEAKVIDDPFSTDGTANPVVLLRAQQPDVSIIHASRADTFGNVVIDGVTSHEVDMVRASKATIVTVEEIVPAGTFDAEPERVTISGAYVSAVVEQRYGAYPTSVYRYYDFAEADVEEYQMAAKQGGEVIQDWLRRNVIWPAGFDAYLTQRDPEMLIRGALEEQMRSLL